MELIFYHKNIAYMADDEGDESNESNESNHDEG